MLGGTKSYKDFIKFGNEGVSKFFKDGGRVDFELGWWRDTGRESWRQRELCYTSFKNIFKNRFSKKFNSSIQ